MKILFELPHDRLTGVNTFTYTVAKYLKSSFNFEIGFYFLNVENKTNLKDKDRDCNIFLNKIDDIGSLVDINSINDYDVAFLCSAYCVELFRGFKGHKIFIGHGLMHGAYFPNLRKIDEFYYVSKFGAEHLSKTLNYPVKYCSNFIDTDRFISTTPINKSLKKVLLLDSRNGHEYKSIFKEACDELGVEFNCVTEKQRPNLIWDIEDEINKADLIVGYGRTVYEAMACGRNVLVYGINGGDGLLTSENINASFDRNCSGWGIHDMKKPAEETKENIVFNIKKYQSNFSDVNRNFVLENLDINNFSKFISLEKTMQLV